MQPLESVKQQLQGAEDLAGVVKTMKTLAAVSIRQYEQAADSLGQYFENVMDGLRMVMWNAGNDYLLPQDPKSDRVGIIVFGSDQGMCGQFNEQVAGFALQQIQRLTDQGLSIRAIVVGSRLVGRLDDAGIIPDAQLEVAGSSAGITPFVQSLLRHIEQLRTQHQVSRFLLYHNRRISASAYQPRELQLLPVQPEKFLRLQQRRWQSRTLPAFTMERSALLSRLIRQYLFVILFQAAAESLAGENASRIAGMQAAERSIEERLHLLRSQYNERRQSSITEELLDVVTGFEALMNR